MKQKLASVIVVLSLASVAEGQVLGLPDQLVARTLFAQVSPSAQQPPPMPLPAGVTLEQYAYVTSQQAYLTSMLQRIEGILQSMQQTSTSRDAVYIRRIDDLERELKTVIDDKATGRTQKITDTLGTLGAAAFSSYAAFRNPKCQP